MFHSGGLFMTALTIERGLLLFMCTHSVMLGVAVGLSTAATMKSATAVSIITAILIFVY